MLIIFLLTSLWFDLTGWKMLITFFFLTSLCFYLLQERKMLISIFFFFSKSLIRPKESERCWKPFFFLTSLWFDLTGWKMLITLHYKVNTPYIKATYKHVIITCTCDHKWTLIGVKLLLTYVYLWYC